MGSDVVRAEHYADMAIGDGPDWKQGTRAVPAGETGAMWHGFRNSGRAKIGGVPAARFSNYFGHELGASGGEHFAIKDGTISGGSVP